MPASPPLVTLENSSGSCQDDGLLSSGNGTTAGLQAVERAIRFPRSGWLQRQVLGIRLQAGIFGRPDASSASPLSRVFCFLPFAHSP